jgi:hypothetical protein
MPVRAPVSRAARDSPGHAMMRLLLAAGFGATLAGTAATAASAQGMHFSAAGGGAVVDSHGRTVVHPAGLLAVGLDAAGPLSLRLDLRGVGNTTTALLGGGFGVGVSGRLGLLPVAYLLGTGSMLLATEGAWTSAYGVAAGAGFRQGAPLFAELRVESMSGEQARVRAQRGAAIASLVLGLRVGGRRPLSHPAGDP